VVTGTAKHNKIIQSITSWALKTILKMATFPKKINHLKDPWRIDMQRKFVCNGVKPGKYILYALSANKKGNGGYNYG
jgi:hypothetical protein